MTTQIELAVFIGRFRPFHNGHLAIVRKALEQANFLNLVVGSANQARSLRNPFTFEEVETMVRTSLTSAENQRVLISPLTDSAYNDEDWVKRVQATVAATAGTLIARSQLPFNKIGGTKIALIGHAKDNTSYYLKLFPQWLSIGVPSHIDLSATQLRDAYFTHSTSDLAKGIYTNIPYGTRQFLREFRQTGDAYKAIQAEYDFVERYKQNYAVPIIPQAVRDRMSSADVQSIGAKPKYPPIFTTADAVVVQSGHVLLIKRGQFPGKGLWAMPGGYVEAHERIEDAWVRELREETRLKVPEAVLRGSVKAREVFDDPHRDPRGRIITHAFLVHLAPNTKLPEVRAGDDAAAAKWVPLGRLTDEDFFSDHGQILQNLVARL